MLQNKIKTNPPQVSTVTLETRIHREHIKGLLPPLFHAIDQLAVSTGEKLWIRNYVFFQHQVLFIN